MSNNELILVELMGDLYAVEHPAGLIVFPNGEIYSVESWDKMVSPPKAGLLVFEMQLPIGPGVNLDMVARGIQGVLATGVKLETYNACPGGCFNPTSPFCSECGSKVEIVTGYVPVVHLPAKVTIKQTPHVIDGVVDVKGEGPCPNCGETLNHDDHADHCPTCGQAFHWTCR